MRTITFDDEVTGKTYSFDWDDSDGATPTEQDYIQVINDAQKNVSTKNNQPEASIPERLVTGAYKNVKDILGGTAKLAGDVALAAPKMAWNVGQAISDVLVNDQSAGTAVKDFLKKQLPVQMGVGLYGTGEKAVQYAEDKVGTGLAGLYQTGKDVGNAMIDNPVNTLTALVPALGLGGKAARYAGMARTADVLDTMYNIPGVAGEKIASKIPYVKEMVIPLGTQLDTTINEGLQKALKSRQGTSTKAFKAHQEELTGGAKDIIANKNSLVYEDTMGNQRTGLPESLEDLMNASHQNKTILFARQEQISKAAGQILSPIDINPTIKKLMAYADDNTISNTTSRNYARQQAERLALLTPEQRTFSSIQNQLSEINSRLTTYWKDPAYGLNNGTIDRKMWASLRETLDDELAKIGGEGWLETRRAYGRATALEKAAVKAVNRELGKQKGLIQQGTNIFSGQEFIHGVASQSWPIMIAGGGAKTIQMIQKALADPNKIIKRMFKGADKITDRLPPDTSKYTVPTQKALPPGNPNAGSEIYDLSSPTAITSEGEVLMRQGVGEYTPLVSPTSELNTVGTSSVRGIRGEYPESLYHFGTPTQIVKPEFKIPKSVITNKIDIADKIAKQFEMGVGPRNVPRAYGVKKKTGVLYGGE